MSDANPVADELPRTGTRWRRVVAVALPSLAVAGMATYAMVSGVVAATLTVQDSPMKLAASGLFARNAGFAMADTYKKCKAGTGGDNATACVPEPVDRVLRAGFADGRINEMCVTIPESVKIAGISTDFVVKMTAGDGSLATWEINAKNVEMDVTAMGPGLLYESSTTRYTNDPNHTKVGVTSFELDGDVTINAAGDGVTTIKDATGAYVSNPLGASTTSHDFGIDATYAKIGGLREATAYQLDIPDFLTLKGLSIKVLRAGDAGATCPVPPAVTTWPLGPVKGDITPPFGVSASCLDSPSSTLAEGSNLTLYACHGHPNQQMYVENPDAGETSAGSISMQQDRCLTASGTTAGSIVQIRNCVARSDATWGAKQKWVYGADRSVSTTLQLAGTNLCLQPSGGSNSNGTTIVLATCGSPAPASQRWLLPK